MDAGNRSRGRFHFHLGSLLILVFLSLPHAGIPDRISPAGEPEPGCDPRSPLEFRLLLVDFVPGTKGGLATIAIEIEPWAEMGEVVVTGRLKTGLRFGDGATEKSWSAAVPAGTVQSIPDSIQVPDNGLYIIKLDAEAVLRDGTPVHRSRGLRIYAGVEPPRPKRRGRALEFPAAVPEGPLP